MSVGGGYIAGDQEVNLGSDSNFIILNGIDNQTNNNFGGGYIYKDASGVRKAYLFMGVAISNTFTLSSAYQSINVGDHRRMSVKLDNSDNVWVSTKQQTGGLASQYEAIHYFECK